MDRSLVAPGLAAASLAVGSLGAPKVAVISHAVTTTLPGPADLWALVALKAVAVTKTAAALAAQTTGTTGTGSGAPLPSPPGPIPLRPA